MSSSAERKVEELRRNAENYKWSKVIQAYKQESALRTAKITPTGDTVLHMALSYGAEKSVADMVDFLVKEDKSTAQDIESSWNKNIFLGIENDRKDTPSHLAVRMGSGWICVLIGRADPSLIARRNIDGETPLFLAALYGQRRTFLWLHYLYVQSHEVSSTDFAHKCIRDNRDTILHCAIAEGHFDVAIEIVHLYKDNLKEMMRCNKEGLTPLHLLAAQRSAFKTTALLEVPSLLHPIYWLWKVEEMKQATTFEEVQSDRRWIVEEGRWIVEEVMQATTIEELLNFAYRLASRFSSNFTGSVWLLSIMLLLVAMLFVAMGLEMLLLMLLPISFLLSTSFSGAEKWFPNIPRMKKKHTRCYQIMTELLQHPSDEDMSLVRTKSASQQFSDSLQSGELNEPEAMAKAPSGTVTIETPLTIAVKNGVVEMVEKILELFPSTINYVNAEGKNILLLAVEYRQTNVYRFLWKQKWINESVFRKVDKEGNNALHLAARIGVETDDWHNPGESLSMEKEINWFEFVKHTMPRAGLLGRYNKNMETPEETFRESHKKLMKSRSEWVVKTSKACSVVSTLVVSVAFSTRTNVPGGYEGGNGYAVLRNNPSEFKTFRDSSLVALLFSLTSTICFLSIVAASRSQSAHHHSWTYIPSKFYCGVYFMFASIVCLWISFCAADFFMLHDHTHKLNKALPTYISLSMGFFIVVALQLPIFLGPRLSRDLRIISPGREATGPFEFRRTNNKDTDSNKQN